MDSKRRGEWDRVEDKSWTQIQFGSYNIRNVQNGGLESALRGMSQANLDLGDLHETKLTDGVYTCDSDGYIIVAKEMPIQHCITVVVFYQYYPWFVVE